MNLRLTRKNDSCMSQGHFQISLMLLTDVFDWPIGQPLAFLMTFV